MTHYVTQLKVLFLFMARTMSIVDRVSAELGKASNFILKIPGLEKNEIIDNRSRKAWNAV